MAFAADNEAHDGVERIIVEVTLSDNYTVRDTTAYSLAEIGASPTLYLCDYSDPHTDGSLVITSQPYFPLISNHSWRPAKAGYLDQPSDADAWIELDNRPYPWQRRLSFGYANRESSDEVVKLSQLFSQYRIEAITIWSVIGLHSGATPSTQQIFKGRLYQPQTGRGKIRLQLVQNKDWDVTFPSKGNPTGGTGPSIIDRVSYPDAPASVIGQTIPFVCCGDPTGDYVDGGYAYKSDHLLSVNPALLHGLAPMILRSVKYDGTRVGTLIGNKYPSLGTPSPGIELALMSVPEVNSLAVLIAGGSPSADTREAIFEMPVAASAYIYLNPTQHISATSCANSERAWDGKWDTYAELQDATGTLRLKIPNIGNLGKITRLTAFAMLTRSSTVGTGVNTGAGGASVNGTMQIYNETTGVTYDGTNYNIKKDDIDAGAGGDPLILAGNATGTDLTGAYVNNWQWVRDNAGTPENLSFRINSTVAGVKLRVKACGFYVEFEPMNLFREVHRKQRVPIIGVGGRVEGWREV